MAGMRLTAEMRSMSLAYIGDTADIDTEFASLVAIAALTPPQHWRGHRTHARTFKPASAISLSRRYAARNPACCWTRPTPTLRL